MAEYELSEAARQTFVGKLGLDPAAIAQTLTAPDKTEILKVNGLELRVLVRSEAGRKPSVMVVCIQVVPKKSIAFVLRLFNDFPKAIHQCQPLELVELAARRFGIELQIGDVKDRFFLRRDIPVSSPDPSKFVRFPTPNHDLHFIQFFRVSATQPHVASCAFVFGLNVDAYQTYLRRWTR